MSNILSFKTYYLKESAFDYIRDRLDFKTPLSLLLSNFIQKNKGEIFTFFPDNINTEKLNMYDEGDIIPQTGRTIDLNGLKAQEVVTTIDGLVDYIHNFLQINGNNILLLEDVLTKPEDNFYREKVFIVEETIYFVLNKSYEKNEILKVLRYCSSFPPAIGVFAQVKDFTNKSEKSLDISKIVKATERFFIEAYDHEGYIIWEKL